MGKSLGVFPSSHMDPRIEQQFLAAYDSYQDAIYRHCYFRLLHKERAEEFTQETFMKTWQYLQQGKEVDNLRPFLYRVANNLIIDYIRRKKEISLDAILEDQPHKEPENTDHLQMTRQIQLHEIERGLEQLPTDQRDLVVMRYIDDMDPKDIAELLGITSSHVSVRLNRAMKSLRELLDTPH